MAACIRPPFGYCPPPLRAPRRNRARPQGRLFAVSEVAVELFQESPVAFSKELRAGRYAKVHTVRPDVARTCAALGIPPDGSGAAGTTLLAAETVEQLLADRRRSELVTPFKLALLKLSSQEAARLMAQGAYEQALPVTLDAVRQGQALFRPSPALQLFPLYLLAAQANLGLRRAKQCEDFLGLASWLVLKEPEGTTNVMRSQLSRLFGQLYASQGKTGDALAAFAEDVYYCALEYGPEDVRTSLGYYNLSKVFEADGDGAKALSCSDHVIKIWLDVLAALVLGEDARRMIGNDAGTADADDEEKGGESGEGANAAREVAPVTALPLGESQLLEVVEMLQDVCALRGELLGEAHASVGDARLASALALAHVGDVVGARDHLAMARQAYDQCGHQGRQALIGRAQEACA